MAVASSPMPAGAEGSRRRVIAADWLITSVTPPIRDGAVLVDGSTVGWVGPLAELRSQWRDLPVDRRRGVLCPGLVNAHTHLQYTSFHPLGQGTYPSFEDWSYAFEDAYVAVTDPAAWGSSARLGVRQATRAGTTVFGEIVTNRQAQGTLAAHGVSGIEYVEAIGLPDERWRARARAEFLAELDRAEAGSPGRGRRNTVRVGISPHAPYSLDGSVIRDLVAIAGERGMRVHSHVAESSVEVNLYKHGDRSVLEIYGDLRDEFELVRRGGTGHDTATYADSVGLLDANTHLAHAVYLDRPGRDLLRRRGTQVALCPRSNAVLGLTPAAVAAYLAEGHEIAVGTDSLASCPSLDLLADVALLARHARDQGYAGDDLAARLVRAATVGGAKALGFADAGYGTLTPGGPADLAVFDLPIDGPSPEAALVEHGAGRCVLTVAAGAVLHDAARISSAARSGPV